MFCFFHISLFEIPYLQQFLFCKNRVATPQFICVMHIESISLIISLVSGVPIDVKDARIFTSSAFFDVILAVY